jgi:hypothetical protein
MAGNTSWTRKLAWPAVLLGWLASGSAARADEASRKTAPPTAGGAVVLQTAAASDEDPAAAGKKASVALCERMGKAPLRAVLISECFEDKENKAKLLAAVSAEFPGAIVVGAATYGSFFQAGCQDADSVCLLGIGGEGIAASSALVTKLGTAKLTFQEHRAAIESKLRAAGAQLAGKLARSDKDALLILLADAHSPKNQPLIEGVQQVVGKKFPITGGCANKNAGQTFVYYNGRMHEDSAVALMLSGDFRVGMAGRQARDHDAVLRTAEESAKAALAAPAAGQGKPIAALAFDCAGRRGKLKKTEDELAAVQRAIGRQLPLFGCYCAGEMGPVDEPGAKSDALSGGAGWHIMFTVLTQ